jgi:DNA replication protein DnaC
MPTGFPTPILNCLLCGAPFEPERDEEMERIFGRRIMVRVCEACVARDEHERERERARAKARTTAPVGLTAAERRRRRWIAEVGPRYAEFRRDELPATIQPHVDRVLSWSPKLPGATAGRGLGLLGPSRTGKSPLLFALGQRLHMAGHEVLPTSGIAFQRMVHRSVEQRAEWERYLERCESAEVLLLDDADKLNFTPGVEAEYYGMLETRRNWLRPVLCTLNLSGAELAALGRERSDRANAIVERLRDLCEFVCVGAG